MLTGERPEVNAEVAERLRSYGHDDFVSYVVWACERALERGMLPHTNLGVLDREDLARLREVTASQGLMLESVSERLMETVHAGSPTKHPARRLETIDAAGELRIPFTSGILVGIGETEEERVASLEAMAAFHDAPRPHPGGDPPELRPASRATTGARSRTSPTRRRRSAGPADDGVGPLDRQTGREADAGVGRCRRSESIEDMKRLVAESQAADARRRRADPAEPGGLVGRAGRGGRHRPRRPVGQRRPHLARARVPEPAPGAQAAAPSRGSR